MITVDIKPGVITIDSITKITESEDTIILTISCADKYPRISACAGNELVLTGCQQTVYHKTNTALVLEPTIIKFGTNFNNADWLLFAEVSRYTIMIAYYNSYAKNKITLFERELHEIKAL